MKMYSHIIINPFIVYSIVWSFVLFVYNLKWSYLLPPLSIELKLFIWFSIILSFFTGLAFHAKKVFSYKSLEHKPDIYRLKLVLYVLWFLLILEFVYARGIPLVGYIIGDKTISYTEFGLPFIHVIVVNSFELLFIFLYYCYRSTSDISIKKKLKLYMFLSVLPYILIFNRMGLMVCFLAGLIIFILSKKSVSRVITKIIFTSTLVIYLFGLAGDMRLDTSTAKNIILDLGEATQEFKDSYIPKELFWGYLYISTPLANCQHTIDTKKNIDLTWNTIFKFCLFELTPEIINKRISGVLNIKENSANQINSTFNVSSVYTGAYIYLGWWGMIFMYFFMYIFIFISMLFIPKESPYHVCGIVIIDIMIIFNVFSNMFVFMGVIPQVLFAIILSYSFLLKRLKSKRELNMNV